MNPPPEEIPQRFTVLQIDFSKGWPNADDIYYECLKCGDRVRSNIDGQCACGNIVVDVDAGRGGALDEKSVRVLKSNDSEQSGGPRTSGSD